MAVATAVVLVAIGVAPFLSPAWVFAEQDRAHADAWTGWPPAEVHRVTGEVLHDLVLGPPAFAQLDPTGAPVFDAREQGHLRDVRSVFGVAAALALAALLVLLGAAVVGARRPRAAELAWHAVLLGSRALAVAVVGLGLVAVVAFDAAFEVFHRLFFAQGTYTFDPLTERLVQLFPDAFWSETSIALGAVLLILAIGTATLAGRRVAAARRRADRAGSVGAAVPATDPGIESRAAVGSGR